MLLQKFEINHDGNDYIVGDIHGCFSKLDEQLTVLGFDKTRDRLFCVGDLVDRGPESERCLEWLDQPWFFSVRGNHEQMAINFMAGHNSALHYGMNGGEWFIGLDDDKQKMYAKNFDELPYAIEVDTAYGPVGIIHAEVYMNSWESLEFNLKSRGGKNVALWERTRIETGSKKPVKGIERVYVGHTPVKDEFVLGNTHYIDGGSCFKDGKFIIVNLTQDIKDTTHDS